MAAQLHLFVDPNGTMALGRQRADAVIVGEVRAIAAGVFQSFVTDPNMRGVGGLQGASVVKVARKIESEAGAGRVSYIPDVVAE